MTNKIKTLKRYSIYILIILHFSYVVWLGIPPKKTVDLHLDKQILPAWYVDSVKYFYTLKDSIDTKYLNKMRPWSKYTAPYHQKWWLFAFVPADRFYNFKIYKGLPVDGAASETIDHLLYDSQLYLPVRLRPTIEAHDWRILHAFPKFLGFNKKADDSALSEFALYFVKKNELKTSAKINSYFLVSEAECAMYSVFSSFKSCYEKSVYQWTQND